MVIPFILKRYSQENHHEWEIGSEGRMKEGKKEIERERHGQTDRKTDREQNHSWGLYLPETFEILLNVWLVVYGTVLKQISQVLQRVQ